MEHRAALAHRCIALRPVWRKQQRVECVQQRVQLFEQRRCVCLVAVPARGHPEARHDEVELGHQLVREANLHLKHHVRVRLVRLVGRRRPGTSRNTCRRDWLIFLLGHHCYEGFALQSVRSAFERSLVNARTCIGRHRLRSFLPWYE
jgi:hypothetical protein